MSFYLKKALLLSSIFIFTACASKIKTEGEKAIESFYKSYFETLNEPNKSKPNLILSSHFSELIAQNRKVCKEKAGSDLCGWDALHGDDYLNAQEIDSDLTFENSEFETSEPKLNRIRVEFNVFPSAKVNKSSYNRVIEYIMIREESSLVVDDIITDGKSLKKLLTDEIEIYKGTDSKKNSHQNLVSIIVTQK